MKKILKILLILIGILLLISSKDKFQQQVLGKTTQAIGDLTIDWGVPAGKPIFMINNFMPGQEEMRTVKIKNNSTNKRLIGVQGVKTSIFGFLSNVLEITISENGNDLYGGSKGKRTLSFFFLESLLNNVQLFWLNPNETKAVTFKVKFKESAGNLYQKTKVVFDIKVGYFQTTLPGCKENKFFGPLVPKFPSRCFKTN